MSGSANFRILVADDEEGVRASYRAALAPTGTNVASQQIKALENELFGGAVSTAAEEDADLDVGFSVDFVSQGDAAVDAVRKAVDEGRPYTVVFLDARMPPGIDGIAAAQAMRPLDPILNIVLVTAYSDIDLGDMARLVPPAERLLFIAKPFQPTEIRQHAIALSQRWASEHALVAVLEEQNASLKHLAAEAEAARREAETANRAKSMFLANVGHELRTPLNAIIGFSELMKGELFGPLGDARYLDYSTQIHESGHSLLESINVILDAARFEIGRVTLAKEAVDAAECVRSVVADLEPFALRNGVALSIDAAQAGCEIEADPSRLRQILRNLVHNAIRFTPKGGSATVSIVRDSDAVVISIADTGVGIAPEAIDAVQKPFRQADASMTRRHDGLGLGLSIAKGLTDLHGASLTIATSLGKGTTIRLRFPLPTPQALSIAEQRSCA